MAQNWEAHGPPNVTIGALSIWVHGYQFPDAADAWDGNWLRVTARCVDSAASVKVTGAILDTVSFVRFRRELKTLYYLPAVLAGCDSVWREYPVKDAASRGV